MAIYMWFKVPDDLVLCDRSNWASLGNDRYGMVRKLFVVVARKGTHTEDGPVLFERTLPVGSEIKYERKQSVITKNTVSINTSVQRTVTTRLASEISSKLNADIGLCPISPTAKATTGLESKLSAEFTDILTTNLSGVKSYEISKAEEFTSSLTLKTPAQFDSLQKYYFFLPVWRWDWDIYLYSQELLEFSYRKSWVLRRVRDSYAHDNQLLKLPLARLSFYEPQDDFPSMRSTPFSGPVADPGIIVAEPLDLASASACPHLTDRDQMSLKDFAEIAFPVSKKEKAQARRVKPKLLQKRTPKDDFVDRVARPTASKDGRPRTKGSKHTLQKTSRKKTMKKPSTKKAPAK